MHQLRQPLFVACALLAATVSEHKLEGRGYPGCSPGRVCVVPPIKNIFGPGPFSFIRALDPMQRDDVTNHPVGFFPNYGAEGPLRPAVQQLTWEDMLVVGIVDGHEVRATPNPNFVSTLKMVSQQEDGVPFFPATHIVELFMVWDLGNGSSVFNAEPLRFVSDTPLTGFPPQFGPNYHLAEPVAIYDSGNPQGPPFDVINLAELGSDSEHLFDVNLVRLDADTYRATVRTRQSGLSLPAKIFIEATPGFGIARSEFNAVLTNLPTSFDVQAVPPQAPCFDYIEAWAVSMDFRRPGSGTRMVELPNAPSCDEPIPLARAGGPGTAHEGESAQLFATGTIGNSIVHYNWVAPHGVTLDDPTAQSPTFIPPWTDRDQELVFSLFVDDGQKISPLSAVSVIAQNRVELHDVAGFQNCCGPFGTQQRVPCGRYFFDSDDDVDPNDLRGFLQTLEGP